MKGGKYATYDWKIIQNRYNVSSVKVIQKEFNLTWYAILWAKENNKLVTLSKYEAIRLRVQSGKYTQKDTDDIKRYRYLCEFKFGLKDYPDEFNFDLIREHGWYKAKNIGDNRNGVCRDHKYSVREGYKNEVDPYYISHPVNCELLTHQDNITKKTDCSITLDELYANVKKWNEKYGVYGEVYNKDIRNNLFSNRKNTPYITKSIKYYDMVCLGCGNKFKSTRTVAKYCSHTCAALCRRKPDRPSLYELEVHIKNGIPFTKIGELCGVSDNCIKKWIKSMSDNDSTLHLHSNKIYKCEYCKKVVKSVSILKKHNKACDSNPDIKKCNCCGKTFETHKQLSGHNAWCGVNKDRIGNIPRSTT